MHRSLRATLILALLCAPVAALAHSETAHGATAHGEAPGWSFEWLAAFLLATSAAFYVTGLARMKQRQRLAMAPRWRIGCYLAAVIIVVIAVFSPLGALADGSFAWHMAQHLLLMLVAAPLLSLANTHLVALMALPQRWRGPVGRGVSRAPGVQAGASSRAAPFVAALAFAGGLWLWHAPAAYDAALTDDALHTVEHLTFIVTAAVFWRMVSTTGNRRMSGMSALVLVTLVCLQGNLLAALLTLAPQPLYAPYAGNPLADQQIAGLIMWVPAGLIYLGSSCWALRSLFSTPVKKEG